MENSRVIEMLVDGVESHSVDFSFDLARSLAKELAGNTDVFITLSGDLGAGKTAFAKGLAAGFGVADSVKSPSYNICSIYDGAGGVKFVHVDAYRLASAEAFEELLLDELAPTPRVICVEWPEAIEELVPPTALRIYIESLPDKPRRIVLKKI